MSDGSPDIKQMNPPPGPVERRSTWRLFLDRLGLRQDPRKQEARHPERIGLK